MRLTFEEFQKLCIVAGCNYLDNVRGIGIERAYTLVCGRDLFDNLTRKGAPVDYEDNFKKALAVFKHQTVFDIELMKCRPINIWSEQATDELQHFCGMYP